MIARNKRAVTLNLSHLADRELLERLAADTDVLVENFRPGVLEKWASARTACTRSTRRW